MYGAVGADELPSKCRAEAEGSDCTASWQASGLGLADFIKKLQFHHETVQSGKIAVTMEAFAHMSAVTK